jgi:hypothetical protein
VSRSSAVAASGEEPLDRHVVKVEKVACLLMRESGFFMAALSTGFKEAKDMALDYHADSEQGEPGRRGEEGDSRLCEAQNDRLIESLCAAALWQNARTCSCCCG